MPRALLPWVVVLPLSALGVLGGHELAYGLTGAAGDELHEYLSHLPQIALIFGLLALVATSFADRGQRIALWPFPAVVMTGFVVQEHLERLAHDGTMPFLLDKPFFVVGLGVQAMVACIAWLVARALIRIVGSRSAPVPPCGRFPTEQRRPAGVLLVDRFCPSQHGSRAPPFGC